MSTQSQNSDAFAMYKQNVQKYFENISKLTPQYFESVTHLQDECMKTCEKIIATSVSMQQEFAKNVGITSEIPEQSKMIIGDTTKQIEQTNTIANQFAKTAIDTTTQNIKAFSSNFDAFAEMNKSIFQLWTTTFSQKK